MLFVPKVSELIWASIRTAVLQDSIVRVTSALSITNDELLKCREAKTTIPDYCQIAIRLFDSIALLGPMLNTDIRSACNRSNKPGTLLFGDDLTKTLNDSKLQGKILARNQFTPIRFAPFHYQKKQHVLPKRGRGSYPPQQSPRQFQTPYKNQARHCGLFYRT